MVQSGSALPADIDLKDPSLYLNRELTWLAFNSRVLHEAEDERNPLLERLKFLAIVSSNLDEFFQKRIGGLKQQVGAGVTKLTVDGRTPREQISQCYAIVNEQEGPGSKNCQLIGVRMYGRPISFPVPRNRRWACSTTRW